MFTAQLLELRFFINLNNSPVTSLEEGSSANIQILVNTNGVVTVEDPINFNLNLTGITAGMNLNASLLYKYKYRGGSL